MNQDDRSKLISILGMLGSEHAGERDAAALAASRMVKRMGLTWAEVLAVPAAPEPRRASPADMQSAAEMQRAYAMAAMQQRQRDVGREHEKFRRDMEAWRQRAMAEAEARRKNSYSTRA